MLKLGTVKRQQTRRDIITDLLMFLFTITMCIIIPNMCLSILVAMIPLNDFIRVLATIAPSTSILMAITPISALKDALKKESVDVYPFAVFYAQLVCNILQIGYGVAVHNIAIIIPNLFSMFCQITWLSYGNHIKFFGRNASWFAFFFSYTLILNIGLATCLKLPLSLLGTIITVCNIALYGSPLLTMGEILETRDRSSLNVPISVMMCIANAAWVAYTSMIHDQVILIPSVFGYVLAVIQIITILWCDNRLPYNLEFLLLIFPKKM